jgi:hypothetical protein
VAALITAPIQTSLILETATPREDLAEGEGFALKKSAKIVNAEIRVAAILVNARLHFRGRK